MSSAGEKSKEAASTNESLVSRPDVTVEVPICVLRYKSYRRWCFRDDADGLAIDLKITFQEEYEANDTTQTQITTTAQMTDLAHKASLHGHLIGGMVFVLECETACWSSHGFVGCFRTLRWQIIQLVV